jgi:hypothetical protein
MQIGTAIESILEPSGNQPCFRRDPDFGPDFDFGWGWTQPR